MPQTPAHRPTNASRPIRPLSGRRRLFCERIAAGASGAEAARAAGYAASNAAQQAWRLLQKPVVQAEVERLRESAELRSQAELDRLLAKVERVFSRAIRDGQCAAALRAVQLEFMLRGRGARSLPDDVSPADLAGTPLDESLLRPVLHRATRGGGGL